jgi:hypothetical protein
MKDLFFKDEAAEVERLHEQYKAASLALFVKKDACARRFHKALREELNLHNAAAAVFLGRLLVKTMVKIVSMELISIEIDPGLNQQEIACANNAINALMLAKYLEHKGANIYKPTASFATRVNELRFAIEAEWEAEQLL